MPRDSKKGFKEAERRIEEARKNTATNLDLSDLNLTKLPDAIGDLTRLQVLILYSNKLTTLPESIGRLEQLQTLHVFNNQLTALPDAICDLKHLRELNVHSNEITALPEAIANLSEFRVLELGNNPFGALPNAIGEFKQLQELGVFQTDLTELPDAIGELNQICRLQIGSNQFTVVPTAVRKLKQLRHLDLTNSNLTEVPEWLALLPKLEELYLHDNDALGIPPEILGPTYSDVFFEKETAAKPADILAYYFRSRKEVARRLNEAKILLVGQGGVGKTSLVKRLVHDEYDKYEAKTEGINIERWEVPGRSIDGDKPEPVRLNIWDFGGQEIMHATHQFFLTKRSLYLLLIDARQGEIEGNIHYWLRIMQSYGGDAPVLIVTNKIEAHPLDLNETRLKKDYAPNVQGFFKVSCATGEGINELREAIEKHVNALPHVRDKLPLSYFRIKQKLEADAESSNYIDAADYHALCKANGVKDEGERDTLLRFLHDLGGVLNFDDPHSPLAVRDTKILNPKWVTGGVYKILNDLELAKDDGELMLTRLKKILLEADGYPAGRHAFIIGIMRKFDLCFEFAGLKGKRLLIPELLPKNEPDLNWDTSDALNFEYHYTVLPSGLISRFIVRTHDNLTSKPTYWRSGVLLEIDGNRALVRADMENERVYISVAGSNAGQARRRALSVIRDAFKVIHQSIPRLDAVQKVPLPDNPNVVVDYKHLITLEVKKILTIVPEGTEEEYAVAELLDGIEKREDRRVRLAQETQYSSLDKKPESLEISKSPKADGTLGDQSRPAPTWQMITTGAFGLFFLCVLLAVAIVFPTPTPFQIFVFRVVLALAAAGLGALIPGFIEVKFRGWLRAGGALALFAIVYSVNPPSLATGATMNTPAEATPTQLEGDAAKTPGADSP